MITTSSKCLPRNSAGRFRFTDLPYQTSPRAFATERILLLRLFAAAGGTLDAARLADALKGDTPLKSRILRLRQFLQNLLDIDGDPFSYAKKAQTYTCQFRVDLDRVDGFRTMRRRRIC